jgi:hypothetical protein
MPAGGTWLTFAALPHHGRVVGVDSLREAVAVETHSAIVRVPAFAWIHHLPVVDKRSACRQTGFNSLSLC